MDWMHARTRLAIVVVAAAIVASACTSGGASADKAGGSGEPVVLRMANTYGDLGDLPAVAYFIDRVEELSGGDVRIEVVDQWGDFASDAEQQVVRDVSNGEVDLGWVGARVFDTLGVESFQALTAPMLVDSYALENAVIDSGITDQMMRGLEDVGVVGLGVLADGLRKPIGITGPVLGPADWRGITFGTLKSDGQAEAIRALGATPAQVLGPHREEVIENGEIQGFEFNLLNYRDPKWVRLAPYVTANVNMWPQMDVVVADPDRLEGLTSGQRGWLQRAADDAADRSAALADTDADSIRITCDAGARFANASEDDLAALQGAFASVYANLQQDPETKEFIEQIKALKQSTPVGPALVISSDCTGQAPEQSAEGTVAAPAYLNGIYRYELTREDAIAFDPEAQDLDEFPQVNTMVLEDGHLEGGCFGSGGATYSVDDDRIMFHSVEYETDSTVTFSVDDKGNLRLTPVPPMDPGDAFQCFSQVWTKIG
jgi:TRAP-type transport system periplasmic protein